MPPKKHSVKAGGCDCCPNFCMDGDALAEHFKKFSVNKNEQVASNSAESVNYEKSKASKTSKSNSKTSDSDSSSSESSSSSTSSTSSASSSSEQVVPNLMKKKSNKSVFTKPEQKDDNEVKEIFINGCNDPNCADSNCNVQIIQAESKCNDPHCSDKNCVTSANSSLPSSVCKDPHCSGCDHDHNSTVVRNTFLGIAGVILLAMIGYMTFIRMKARRSKNSANKEYLPTAEVVQN